jgi:hypothetical protein
MTAINLSQLKTSVIQPVHTAFGAPYNTPAATVLSLGTAIHETNGGQYLRQISGPALGMWQMEPATYTDCWTNFLNFRPEMAAAVRKFQVPGTGAAQLVWNIGYACAMARVRYIRAPDPLPATDDFEGLAEYYKRFYNSALGAAVVDADLVECFRQAAAA